MTARPRTKTSTNSAKKAGAAAPTRQTLLLNASGIVKRFGNFTANDDVSFSIYEGEIHALLGENGAGKSTFVKMVYGLMQPDSGVLEWRGQPVTITGPQHARDMGIGMVFQQPNPFPKSIYENIAFGARINGFTGDMDELVERSLRQAAVWDECKDKLNESGYSLSGGQQQRLCIARTIAIQPEVILMDEPCSALDPISTLKIEETMHELKKSFTIVIVTHNMQQAVRVSDMTAFYNAEAVEGGSGKVGYLVEFNETEKIFNSPQQQATQDYVSGRFG